MENTEPTNPNLDTPQMNGLEQQDPPPPSLEELISTATVSTFKGVLDEIARVDDAVIQDLQLSKLAKVIGAGKPALAKELKKRMEEISSSGDNGESAGTKRALFPGLVDLVKDDSGKIRYLIKQADGLHLADSWSDADGYTCIPPEQKNIEFLLPDAGRVISSYDETDDHRLYEDLHIFFRRFSYLNPEAWPVIILSVFLSYIQDHRDVRYIPGIYFYAVAERGKSRTAKTMLATSYRGIHLVDVRPANIVRFSERLNATLFFDVTDLWKSAEKGDGCDILLGRFEKGTRVARVLNPEKGPFDDQTFFNVYGSTIFATNEPANSIFESRCLSITMPNMPGHYENLTPEMALPLKDRLTAWRARMIEKNLPEVEPLEGIGGRLWDISRPLFQLAQMVAPETFEMIRTVVLGMAGQKVENKRDTLEGKIVDAVDKLVDRKAPEPWEVPVEKIRGHVNATIANDQYHYSSQKIGRRIESLGVESKKICGLARVRITARELNMLKEQHGLLEPRLHQQTRPLSTTRQDAANTGLHAGRQLPENQQLAPNSQTQKAVEMQADGRVGESGSESPTLTAAIADKYQAYLALVDDTSKPETTAPAEVEQPKKPALIWKKSGQNISASRVTHTFN
jgi:hypothetical protein